MRITAGAIAVATVATLLVGTACTAASPGDEPGSASAPARTGVTSNPPNTNWLTYQHNQSRTGSIAGSLQPTRIAWTRHLGGVVHGEVVAADGRLFAATETDRVVALNPRTGAVLWSRTVGTPLRNVVGAAGCGDIDPLGITSTPVVDASHHTVYVVAEASTGPTSVHHQLFGLSTSTGKLTFSRRVDPPLPGGERAIHLLQRDALALVDGRIYIGFGGNDGDCGAYHGWLVAAPIDGKGANTSFEVDGGGQGGAIWQAGGGPAVDPAHDVYVSTGNSNPFPHSAADPGKYAESVVKLSTGGLSVLHSFKDPVASADADLSTGNPVLLPGGLVFAVGKTDVVYVLRRSNLTKVAQIAGVCGSDPDGGPAYDAATGVMFVPCSGGGIQEVEVTRHRLGPRLSGANSTPIIVGSKLYAVQYDSGRVYEYNVRTGRTIRTLPTTGQVPHFASPSTAFGLLLVPTNTGVSAYR